MNIPSLGPRGEGWVALQFVCLTGAAVGGWLAPGSASDIALALGAVLIFAGGAVATSGLIELRRAVSLSALPYPRPEGRLVQTGAYRLIRHPIYGGLILMTVGWATLRVSPVAAAAAVALAIVFDLKRRREEAWLTSRYSGYAAYQTHTKALIPFLY